MRFGGGTNEVLRDVIAQRGHGMPSYGAMTHETATRPPSSASSPRRCVALLSAAECPVSLVRALGEPGAALEAPALWKALADAGVFGLAVAEEYGGAGGSLGSRRLLHRGRPRPVPDDGAQHRAAPRWQSISCSADPITSRVAAGAGRRKDRATTALWSPRNAASTTPTLLRARGWTAGDSAARSITSPTPTSPTSSWCRPPRRSAWRSSSPLTAAGLIDGAAAMVGGHRAFRSDSTMSVIDPAAVLIGADGAGLAEQTCAGSPTPRWRCGRSTWSGSARRCWTAPSSTRSCATSSAARSRPSRRHSI